MAHRPGVVETEGVSAAVLSALNLGSKIEGVTERQRGMQQVTIARGGLFSPGHDHRDRPRTVYLLQGIITDH